MIAFVSISSCLSPRFSVSDFYARMSYTTFSISAKIFFPLLSIVVYYCSSSALYLAFPFWTKYIGCFLTSGFFFIPSRWAYWFKSYLMTFIAKSFPLSSLIVCLQPLYMIGPKKLFMTAFPLKSFKSTYEMLIIQLLSGACCREKSISSRSAVERVPSL